MSQKVGMIGRLREDEGTLYDNSISINPYNFVKRTKYIDWSPFLFIK